METSWNPEHIYMALYGGIFTYITESFLGGKFCLQKPYIGRICDGTNMTTGPKTIDSHTENSQELHDKKQETGEWIQKMPWDKATGFGEAGLLQAGQRLY